MSADVETLRETVTKAAKDGPLADAVKSVSVEPARDEDGDAFLRVQLTLELPKGYLDDQLADLIEHIELSVAAVDERYPDVRFLDAA